MFLGECLTRKNVLRATGIVSLLPGIPLLVVPGLLIGKLFSKGGTQDKSDDADEKTEYLGRTVGIASISTGLISVVAPSRELLHVRILEALGSFFLNARHTCEETKEGTKERAVSQAYVGIKALVLIALVVAKHNDDEEGGHKWHKITA